MKKQIPQACFLAFSLFASVFVALQSLIRRNISVLKFAVVAVFIVGTALTLGLISAVFWEEERQSSDRPEKRPVVVSLGVPLLSLCLLLSVVLLCQGGGGLRLFAAGEQGTEDVRNFAPAQTAEKEIWVENNGNTDICYRLYLSEVSGELAEFMYVQVRHGEEILFDAPVATFGRNSRTVDMLRAGERKKLTVSFRFPPYCGNESQNLSLRFTLCAEIVRQSFTT